MTFDVYGILNPNYWRCWFWWLYCEINQAVLHVKLCIEYECFSSFCFLFRDHGVDSLCCRHGNGQSYPGQILCYWMKMDDITMRAWGSRNPNWRRHPPAFICNWRKCIKYMEVDILVKLYFLRDTFCGMRPSQSTEEKLITWGFVGHSRFYFNTN